MSEITRIQNPFSSVDFDNANAALDLLNQVLSDSMGLSARQKSRLNRLGKANLSFVESAHRAMLALPDLRPAYLDPAIFSRDLSLVYHSRDLLLKLKEVASKVEDTQLIMGNEAFYSALGIYRVIQAAYRSGYPGAKPYYDELTDRWSFAFGSSGSNGATTDVEPDSNDENASLIEDAEVIEETGGSMAA